MNKTLIRIFYFFVLALFAIPASACIKQVTGLTASAAAVIVKPGTYAKVIVIQNNGANSVRLSIDGGSTYTDQQTGKVGTDPTTSTGILLPAGAQLVITTQPNASGLHRWISAIMVTSTTILDITTDDSAGSAASTTFPTS